jgi:hypothetical protein
MKLPSEVYYRSENCTDASLLNDIRTKFQTELQTAIRQGAVCARSPGDCIVEDVRTKCTEDVTFVPKQRFLSRRRKRIMQQFMRTRAAQADHSHLEFQLPILFDLGTRLPATGGEWPDEYHRAHRRLFGMFDYFEELMHDGRFRLSDRTSFQLEEVMNSLTHADKKAICDMGYQFNHSYLMCGGCFVVVWVLACVHVSIVLAVPCGAGTYYSILEEQCVQCSPGFFQDEASQFSCKRCPQGTATPEEGATNVSQCVGM